MTTVTAISNYEDAIFDLPPEAFLGDLLWFSISAADVNLDDAHDELTKLGLNTGTMRTILRPVDAFKKASRDVGRKFAPVNGIQSEFLIRQAGNDNRHIILERVLDQGNKRHRLLYEKVGELVFTSGTKQFGAYVDYDVETRRTTSMLTTPLTLAEDAWLTKQLGQFSVRFRHLLHYMDSHAVRTFVREYVYSLSGTCVKESGGLYFVKQAHVAELEKLGGWVRSIGSEFHQLPLLNLVEQREMIMKAFEEETVQEVARLMDKVNEILADPTRQIEGKTFDAYGQRAAELTQKVNEYNAMLGGRADRASIEISTFTMQVMELANRIKRTPKKMAS